MCSKVSCSKIGDNKITSQDYSHVTSLKPGKSNGILLAVT